jgi:hypothetical protein
MLSGEGHTLVSEAVVARVRGMLADLARQLLQAESGEDGRAGPPSGEAIDRLAAHLAEDHVVLGHSYALAMEGHLTERLEQRSSIDPVLSPLLQELIGSDDPSVAELAMATLAAQSRFVQSQRRMDMPLAELPAELFLSVLERWQRDPAQGMREVPVEAAKRLKQSYDEGASRVGLLARLVSAMRGGAIAALELDHAGLALFASGLASLASQPRDTAVIACHESQAARLALAFRAIGLDADAIERQFMLLEPELRVPRTIADIASDRARAILSRNAVRIAEPAA